MLGAGPADSAAGVMISSADACRMDERAVAARFAVDTGHGLSDEDAAKQRQLVGANQLGPPRHAPAWRILLDQFRSLVTLLLAAAAALSFAMGDALEGVAIVLVLLVNGGIGFSMEIRATRSMEALFQLVRVPARVRRAGAVRVCQAEDLVPGDIVLLEAGDLVPADIRLVTANRLAIDEASLTGESVPVSKDPQALPRETPIAERRCVAHSGTAVTRGTAVGIVVSTGLRTEIGRVAELVAGEAQTQTPMELRLETFGRQLIVLVLAIAAFVSVLGIVRGRDPTLMVKVAVALAVAAIPEGLPIVATLALARGVLRMARRNALVNRLASVETLGIVDLLCVDKTGTLTRNEMRVARLVLADGEVMPEGATGLAREALETGALCNDATLTTGDPTEIAFIHGAQDAGIAAEALRARFARVGEHPFDSTEKRMATIHTAGDSGFLVAVKGAPESVLAISSTLRTRDGDIELTPNERDVWLQRSLDLGGEGLRVLAVARKTVSQVDAEPYEHLGFLGLVALHDPPRDDARASVETLRGAGVRVVMMTGDQPGTANAIARAVGITDADESHVVRGYDLDHFETMSEAARAHLRTADVVARVSPEQKLELVELHRQAGRTVAMTGDGVNDAPALKRADIGIAMGIRGTQVAKEAADIVLQDDSLATIGAAIAEGRVIFRSIRRAVVYLLSCNVSEIFVIAIGAALNVPLPLLPLQVLLLNLLTDVFPALALAFGGSDAQVMKQPPRHMANRMLVGRDWVSIGAHGVVITFATLLSFGLALGPLHASAAEATTVSFLTLAFAQLWHVFDMHAVDATARRNGVVRNPYVWGAIVLVASVIFVLDAVPLLASVFSLTRLSLTSYALVLGASFIPLVVGQAWWHVWGQRKLTRARPALRTP